MANVCIFRDGGRLEEYDEFWPVRWARHRVYEKPENTVKPTLPVSFVDVEQLTYASD